MCHDFGKSRTICTAAVPAALAGLLASNVPGAPSSSVAEGTCGFGTVGESIAYSSPQQRSCHLYLK